MAEPRPDQPPTTPEPAEGRARRGLGAWLARAGGELPFASRLDDRVREDLWSRFANEAASVELAHVVLGVLVGAILLGRAPWLPVAGWLAAVVTVTGARLMIRRRAAQGAGRALDSRWRIRWAVVAGAMVWGALPLLLLPYLGVVDLLLLMVILAGMVAAATATLVSDPVSFRGFAVITLTSLAVALLLHGRGRIYLEAALLTVLYLAVLLRVHNQAHRQLVDTLRAKEAAGESEASVARERAFLAALLECSATAIVTLDAGGLILAVNPAFTRLFGYTAPEAVGKDINDLIVPDWARAQATRLDRMVVSENVVITDAVRRRKDGSTVAVRVSAAQAEGAEGAVFVLYDDVTAMKQAERRLQEAEAKYRSLVESASDLVWQVDREGRWQFVNRTCEQIYGVPANSLLGNRFTEVVDPEYLERDLAAFQQVLDGKELTDYETVHRDSRGESRHLSFSARPLLDEDGVVVGASGIARDVTERAAVRAALEAARREAERTAVAKSAFLANMSHEIRTPLNGILGMVELLLDTSLDHEQRRAAELVRESGQALLTVINDILDFSKIEAGRMELEQAEFDLHALVNSTARLLGVRCYERGLELVCEVQAEVPHRVLGDPGRIRQVLNNLVSNAVKFTHDGEVAVTASLERLGGDTAWVRISVRDTGIGIPEEKQEAVFEEFTQVDVTTTRQYGGTGLGLAISRRLVTLLGGSLGLRSEPGRGSEFSFTVPLRVVAGDGPAVTRRPEASLEGVRLLIIDDNSTNRRITGDMLRSAGAVVQEAESARAGLAALRRARGEGAPYQVAILDGHMPEMDGFALAREIKTDPALAATRLMMLTSAGQPGDGQRCRDLGITGYLSKPASRAELLETLGAVLKDTPHPEHATLITRHLISESRQPVRVLVVEDNPVNQQVAAAMLRKRGHAVTIAENGQEALDALRAAAFDVVLMDVQMPVMDGLTATRAIRADPGLADLPVVAMTAHALQEEQQHCRDAGMSAYLAKPFKPHELFAAVEGWQARPATTPPAAADDPDAPVDLARFRAAMRDAGVEDAVETMLDVFLRDAPTRMAALASAIERADAREIEATAHAFKSASGTIGAGRLANLLKTAEFAGRNGQPGRAAETLNALTSEYDAVMTYLSTVTGRRGTSHA